MFTIILILAGLALFMRMQAIPKDFDFPDKLDGLEQVPVDARGMYIKQDDGSVTLDPVVKARMDHSTLSGSLEKERKAKRELEKMVNGFKALGLGDTPEEAMAAIKAELDELGEDGDGSAEDKGRIKSLKAMREKLKGEFEETLKREVGAKDEQLSKMERSLRKNMLEREAILALTKHKGSASLLLPHVISRLGLVEDESGDLVVRVLDKDGDPVGDGKGGYKTVDDFVAEMRNDETYARAFEATGKGGSGMKQFERVKAGGVEQKTTLGKISAGLSRLRRGA